MFNIDLNELCFEDYYSPDYRKVVVDFAEKINIDPRDKNKSVELKNGVIKINKGEKLNSGGIIEKTGQPYLEIFTQNVNLNCYNITASYCYNMLYSYTCLGIKKTTFNPTNEEFIFITNYSYKNKITKKIEKLNLAIVDLPKIDLFNKEYQSIDLISFIGEDHIKNMEDNSLVLTEIGVGLINYNSNLIAENSYEINKLSFVPLITSPRNYPKDINNKLNYFLFNNTQQTSVSYNGNKLNVYRPNTYTVETVEEMNNLTNIEDGDICIVTKGETKRLINIGDNLKGKTIYFKSTDSEICNDFLILEARNLDDNSSKFQILHRTNWWKYTWQILLEEGNNDDQIIEDNNSTLLIDSYTVQGNYQVTSIMDTDDFYLNMYVKEDKQITYRYKDGKWINIEIEQSKINGNIKKGENEIIVYKANRKNNTSHIVDDTNHTITVSLNSYDSPIILKAYKDSNGYTQLYTIIFTEDVVKNISPTYQFQCYYVNDSSASGVFISEINNEYNYLELPIKEGDKNISNLKINISSLSKGLYLTLSSYYSEKGYRNISCEEYFSIPKGIKRLNISAIYSSNHYGKLNINYNENTEFRVSGNYSQDYKNIIVSYGNSNSRMIFKDNNSSINSLKWDSYLQRSYLSILYICDNTEEFSAELKARLNSIGCNKYKNTNNIKSYLLISYNGHTFEYINDTDNISENLSFIIDEDSQNIMLISGNSETDLTDIYNSINKINNMTDSTTALNTTINNNKLAIQDLQKTGKLWMGKLNPTITDILTEDGQQFIQVDHLTGTNGYLKAVNGVLNFKAPYSGTYAFRGRVNFAGTTSNGKLIINIGSGYLIKETNINTDGGDTRLLYINITLTQGQVLAINLDSSSTISVSNVFFEIERYV